MPRILWLPALPSVGAISMDRYWRELDRQRLLHAGEKGMVEIVCPLGTPPERSGEALRPIRIWQKYCAYPVTAWLATRRPGVETVHLFDHSYAHLLPRMPGRGIYKIATVHDLAPLRESDELTGIQQQRFRRVVEHLHRADLILADSRHSAGETIALLGMEPEKVRVLPLGVDCTRFMRSSSSESGRKLLVELAGRKVVLSVGSTVPRKNLRLLPDIFRCLQMPGVTLLRVGVPLPAELAAELRSVLGQDGLVDLGHASDETLVQAYQRANALIFPSRIEGFGFPVLEAMAAGCPVVCTNVTSLPEVGGDAALYFAPDEPSVAAGHLRRLLTEEADIEALVAAGRRQAASFSWEQHFARLLEIYREGAGKSRVMP